MPGPAGRLCGVCVEGVCVCVGGVRSVGQPGRAGPSRRFHSPCAKARNGRASGPTHVCRARNCVLSGALSESLAGLHGRDGRSMQDPKSRPFGRPFRVTGRSAWTGRPGGGGRHLSPSRHRVTPSNSPSVSPSHSQVTPPRPCSLAALRISDSESLRVTPGHTKSVRGASSVLECVRVAPIRSKPVGSRSECSRGFHPYRGTEKGRLGT